MNRRSAVGAEEERADFCASCVSQWCCFWLAMSAFWSIIILASLYRCTGCRTWRGGCRRRGVIQEVALTEQTVAALQTLLEEDGRFRVVLSRKAGEGATVTERNHKFRRRHPDLMLSVHGNASDSSSANGFECYPSPPGYENHEESLAFAACLAQEMQNIGANLRGTGIAGVRYGYYDENGNKLLRDSSDTTVYSYDTFGMLKNMSCPAVLAEQCFITNPSDVESFGTEEGCQRAAQAYYKAICSYLEGAKQ